MAGRTQYRQTDRFYVSVPAKLQYDGKVYEGVTTDISENGMSVCLKDPEYLPDDDEFDVTISSDYYLAKMRCVLIHAIQKPQGWYYSLRITNIEEADRREYFQIVFDRPHTLADKLKDSAVFYDDFALNIGKRLGDDSTFSIRKLPRIRVSEMGTLDDGSKVTVTDFNYKYAFVRGESELPKEKFTVHLESGYKFELEAVQDFPADGKHGMLYNILNWHALVSDAVFMNIVRDWAKAGRV
jgi:cellulose synthase (UDP-forming)